MSSLQHCNCCFKIPIITHRYLYFLCLALKYTNKRKQYALLAIYLCNFLPSLYVFQFSFKYLVSKQPLVSLFEKILIICKFKTKPVHNFHFIYVCYLSIVRNFICKIQLTLHQSSFHCELPHYCHVLKIFRV